MYSTSFFLVIDPCVFIFMFFRDKQIPELAGKYVVQFVLALDKTKHLWSKQVGTYSLFHPVCCKATLRFLAVGYSFVFLS